MSSETCGTCGRPIEVMAARGTGQCGTSGCGYRQPEPADDAVKAPSECSPL